MNDRLKIFLILALIFTVIYAALIIQKKIPFGSDTFQCLQMQYIYFNELAQNRSIPFWFPFMSQGFASNYYFMGQLSILSPLIYFIALFAKNINYLYIFYFTTWFEELFFLMGVILLSSIYYKRREAVFFVSVTLLGANIWFPQVFWNFHLYYFIPMVLFCIHKSLQTGLTRYFFSSLLFLSLAVYGNFLYCIIFASFIIFVYFLLIVPIEFTNIKLFLQKNTRFKNIAVLLILLSLMALSFSYIGHYKDEIAYTQYTRDTSGAVDLRTFLTFGSKIGIGQYADFLNRGLTMEDNNLYAGFFLLPLVAIALLYARKKISFAVGASALIVFLFSLGTFVSSLFYYLWPLGKIFRHIGLTSTVFELFIVFYAGFGLEALLEQPRTPRRVLIYFIIFTLGFLLLQRQIVLRHLPALSIWNGKLPSIIIFLILAVNILLFYLWHKGKFKKGRLINFLLVASLIDIFSYKYYLTVNQMPRASDEVLNLLKPYKYAFAETRAINTHTTLNNNQRLHDFFTTQFWGSAYNTLDSFFFVDSAYSLFRTDFILRPIKEYYDITQSYPFSEEAYSKYAGIYYPKLSVFSKLNIFESQQQIKTLLRSTEFSGDMLLVTEEDILNKAGSIPIELIKHRQSLLFTNDYERAQADIRVNKFSFNQLKLQVNIQGGQQEYYFLYYSDAYHPGWNAYVNGKKTPVIRSNIGYKSILIPSGSSEILFRFGGLFYPLSTYATLIITMCLFIMIIHIFIVQLVNNPGMGNSSAGEV